MSEFKVGQTLQLPSNPKYYGYGVDPLPNDETIVKIQSITPELQCEVIIAIAVDSGKSIRFVLNTTKAQAHANTIDGIVLLDYDEY